jgi:hypothetical protein
LSGVQLKAPGAYRFPPAAYTVSQSVLTFADGGPLLAPEAIVQIVPLLRPQITLETARSFQTVRDFSKIGQTDEGKRRVLAQNLVTTCKRTPQADAALLASIQHGVTALVVANCQPEALSSLQTLLKQSGTWRIRELLYGYVLLLREDHS